MNRGSVEELASSLHTSARQLRRAVRQEYGASPVQLAQTHRLLLAKRLLTESDLPIGEVAFASGFASLRRFNALFQSRYRFSPTRLRRERSNGAVRADAWNTSGDGLTLTLDYRPPFDWEAMLGFLAVRMIPGVEVVRDGRYSRSVAIGVQRGWISVGAAGGGAAALDVTVSASLVSVLMELLSRLRGMFDLDAEPDVIATHLAVDPLLAPYVQRHPGLRVPGTMDAFELVVRAVLGQQVTVAAGTTLAGRLVEHFADATDADVPGLSRFPLSAARVAEAGIDALTSMGIVTARAECIVGIARAFADGDLQLGPGEDADEACRRLQEFPGIDPWTAQYIAMRALHWPDAFPHSDLGIRKALAEPSPARVMAMADRWRPWRSYATMHLWQNLADWPRSHEPPTEDL